MDSLSASITGDRVMVDVEGVFNGGMVVAYNSPDGYEYRGALLLTRSCSTCGKCQPVLTRSVSSLANPLTFIHDHPYSDLEEYTQQISTKMPASIFLHWNSVPDLNSTPSPSPSSPHKLHSRTQNGKVEENVSPASVVASVDQTSGTYSWPYLLKPANQRSAKYAARMKLKERLEVQDANPRSHQRKRNEVSSQAKKPKGRKRSSLGVGRTKTKRPPVEDSFCWFEYTKRRPRSLPPLSPISKFALKELSIPIQRIPVRIRKKMTDNSATRSSSISSSTVDSSTELSSRSSVSPLNSSKTSIIQ